MIESRNESVKRHETFYNFEYNQFNKKPFSPDQFNAVSIEDYHNLILELDKKYFKETKKADEYRSKIHDKIIKIRRKTKLTNTERQKINDLKRKYKNLSQLSTRKYDVNKNMIMSRNNFDQHSEMFKEIYNKFETGDNDPFFDQIADEVSDLDI
jgi:hypothetical protein